jgi:hypothetical protein
MNDIRFDGINGKLENIGTTEACLEFSEWNSKLGLDLLFYGDTDDLRKISLTKDELHCLAVISIASGYIDIDTAKLEAESLLENSKKIREFIAEKKQRMTKPHVLTGCGDLNLLSEDLELSAEEVIK